MLWAARETSQNEQSINKTAMNEVYCDETFSIHPCSNAVWHGGPNVWVSLDRRKKDEDKFHILLDVMPVKCLFIVMVQYVVGF